MFHLKLRLSGAKVDNGTIFVNFRDFDTRNSALSVLKDKHTDFTFTSEDSLNGLFVIKATIKPEKLKEVRTNAVDQNINIIIG